MPSIILPDGALGVATSAATWCHFLQLSRLTNSKCGGWNSISFWDSRGLQNLANSHDVVEIWTRNSLAPQALPKPRLEKFKFAERSAEESRGKGKPTGENALNWQLTLRLRENCVRGETASAYEVPLAGEREGQLKADAMIFHQGGRLEIIELKRAGTKGADSPLMALVECICYAIQAQRTWKDLSKEVKAHLHVETGELNSIHLIIAAPEYWSCCNVGKKEITPTQEKIMTALVKRVAQACKIDMHLTLADLDRDSGKITPRSSSETPRWSLIRRL
ncbi:MAG: hypothetical protein KBC32_05540 [Candidatus Didemnitutus sp.]|nr:hypothetical protein [Candidatus Didemnitutus sp.]